MSLKYVKYCLLFSLILFLSACSKSTLNLFEHTEKTEYQALPFVDMLDATYRFEMDFKLLFKKRSAQGMMSSSIQEDTLYVQYFSDFGKNLLLFKRNIKEQDAAWELVYTLPEMNYEGLHNWFKEDLEILFAKYLPANYEIGKKQEHIQYLKTYSSAQNIVYLQNQKNKEFEKAFLIDNKKKILKELDSNHSAEEINIQYKRRKVTIKYKKLDATR